MDFTKFPPPPNTIARKKIKCYKVCILYTSSDAYEKRENYLGHDRHLNKHKQQVQIKNNYSSKDETQTLIEKVKNEQI